MRPDRWLLLPIVATAAFVAAASDPSEDAVATAVRLGHVAEAETLAATLVQAREQAPGVDSLPLATALDLWVDASRRAGHGPRPEVLEQAERALAIRERRQGIDHVEVSRSLIPMANALRSRGDRARMRAVCERAVALRERAYGPDDPRVAEALIALANAHYDAGDYDQARDLVQRALRIRETRLGAENLETAEALHFLGSIAYLTNDTPKVRDYYERALAIRRTLSPPNHPDLATSFNGMAIYAQSIGDYAASRAWRDQALSIQEKSLGPDHPTLAITLINQSMTVQRLGDFEEARRLARRGLAIRERNLGADNEDTGYALQRLAEVERGSGNLDAALPLLVRALAIRQKALGVDHRSMGAPHHDLALLYYQLGDYARAAAHYRRSVFLYERYWGASDPTLAQIRGDLGVVLACQGRTDSAMAIGLQIERVTREHLRLVTESLSEREALQYADAMNSTRELALSLAAAGRLGDDGLRREAWELLIRSRSPVLEEMVHRRRAVWSGGDSALARLDSSLTTARERLARLMVGAVKDSVAHAAELRAARERCEDAERALSKRSREFAVDRRRDEIGLRAIVSALPRGAALVGFARLPYFANFERPAPGRARRRPGKRIDSYMAFVTGGGDSGIRVVRLGSAERVDRLAARWLEEVAHGALASGRSAAVAEAACRVAGDSLRRAIWDPLSARLRGANQVYVVPDGSLDQVPFAALPAANGGYLIERGPLLHVFASERDAIPREPAEGNGLLAVGGPDYDAAATDATGAISAAVPAAASSATAFRGAAPSCPEFEKIRFAPLPSTLAEVREIAQICATAGDASNDVLLVGPAAAEAAVKRLSRGHRILHLATHGFFVGEGCETAAPATRGVGVAPAPDRQPPARSLAPTMRLSGLALAGANLRSQAGPGDDDGVLTSEEIMALDLRGTEWAVLSACQTGSGEVATGEGVLGLCRAFQIAGARTVITSAFAVEDESARQWMASLYRHRIAARQSTAEAVRSASLDLLRARRARGASTHPFHWAAFQAIGDWR